MSSHPSAWHVFTSRRQPFDLLLRTQDSDYEENAHCQYCGPFEAHSPPQCAAVMRCRHKRDWPLFARVRGQEKDIVDYQKHHEGRTPRQSILKKMKYLRYRCKGDMALVPRTDLWTPPVKRVAKKRRKVRESPGGKQKQKQSAGGSPRKRGGPPSKHTKVVPFQERELS